jgi:hypothetical protein
MEEGVTAARLRPHLDKLEQHWENVSFRFVLQSLLIPFGLQQ